MEKVIGGESSEVYKDKKEKASKRQKSQCKSGHRNKRVQTDAYAITDLDLFLPPLGLETAENKLEYNSEQVSKLLSSLVEQHLPVTLKEKEAKSTGVPRLRPRRFIVNTRLPESSSDELTPCLRGTCRFEQELRILSNPTWLGCRYKYPGTEQYCKYWIHAKCHGFPKMSPEVARQLKDFRCPEHLV